MLTTIILSFFLFQVPGPGMPRPQETPTPAVAPTAARPTPTPQPEEPPVVTKHSVTAGGRVLNYTVTTGFMPIKNALTGETDAKIFYMAYTVDGAADKTKRPLMFSFNGGPGSASVWLHMGALGPKRVKMLDTGGLPPPPYELEDNDQTWLGDTDLVFIDPVGTGYSRATNPANAGRFFSLNGDLESVGEFIRMYLGRNERWSSPLFLVGESYGTTRASGLSNVLFEKGIGLNGILLISTVMNFQTIRFADGNDVTYPLIFPSYTATAWYHKRLPPDLQGRSLREVLKESEAFAANEYTVALAKGDRMTAAEKSALLDKMSRYSGLSKTFIDNNNLRVDLEMFNKELLRDQKRTTGRLDSRFTGIDRMAANDSPDNDPSMNAIRPPYTATFNDYVRRELGFKSDLEYYILGGGITSPWNWNVNNGYANTSVALKQAMQKNPYMKIFVGCGYYDMATPYFAAEYSFANMNLDPSLRKNVSFNYYEAGHMMYIDKISLKKLKDDASAFIQTSLRK
jgi:carboxypeptidase C (cathepsin A)